MEENAKEKMKKLKIITINIRGAFANKLKKNEQFYEVIKNNDVIMLQETHYGTCEPSSDENQASVVKMTKRDFQNLNRKLKKGVTGYFTSFSSNKRGVGIIINTKHQLITHFNHNGDYIGVSANIEGCKYIFVSFYFHKNENEVLLNRFKNHITGKQGMHVIGGDFNVTMDPPSDMKDVKANYPHKKRMKIIKKVWPYTDVWRDKHPNSEEYTRTNTIEGKVTQQTRLDYFYMMKKDIHPTTECEILKDVLPTDHKAVQLSLVVPTGSSGGDSPGDLLGGARDDDEVEIEVEVFNDYNYLTKNVEYADDGPNKILMSIQEASAQNV